MTLLSPSPGEGRLSNPPRPPVFWAVLGAFWVFLSPKVWAQDDLTPGLATGPGVVDRGFKEILLPIASFFYPGLGQWIYGEWEAGLALSSAGYLGYSYQSRWAHKVYGVSDFKDHFDPGGGSKIPLALDSKDNLYRRRLLGRLVQQGAGGLSLYSSFRTSVLAIQPEGHYGFMGKPDSVLDILAAPFDLTYLKRPTTALVLLLGLGLNIGNVLAGMPDRIPRDRLSLADGFYTATYSFNAGTHEEAVFRGWLMPVLKGATGLDWFANLAQATLFGLAHRNQLEMPLFQTMMGGYLGYLTIRADYHLGEAVFLHTWWDVMAIGASYAFKATSKDRKGWIPPPVVVTPFHLVF